MNELLKTLQDYQHVLLIAFLVFGWRKVKDFRDAEVRSAHERDAAMDARIDKAVSTSLKNGVGEMMRRLISDHEVVEQRHLAAAIQPYDARLREVEKQLRWDRGGAT